jgi:hypothetical protein
MISELAIKTLPHTKPRLYDFGLNESDYERLSCLVPIGIGSSDATFSSSLIGLITAWGVWFMCIFGLWGWQESVGYITAIFGAVLIGCLFCNPIGLFVLPRIIMIIERRIIKNTKIYAFTHYTIEVANITRKFTEAYCNLGISNESKILKRIYETDKILNSYSKIFDDPKIENAHFVSSKFLPVSRKEIAMIFKNEILISLWTDANPVYLEFLKANFILNLPRFIDIKEDLLNDPVQDLILSSQKAQYHEVPVDHHKLMEKTKSLMTSKKRNEYVEAVKSETFNMENNELWVKMIELLVKKTKTFDNNYFFIPNSSTNY